MLPQGPSGAIQGDALKLYKLGYLMERKKTNIFTWLYLNDSKFGFA
jgi:hypothetical protein